MLPAQDDARGCPIHIRPRQAGNLPLAPAGHVAEASEVLKVGRQRGGDPLERARLEEPLAGWRLLEEGDVGGRTEALLQHGQPKRPLKYRQLSVHGGRSHPTRTDPVSGPRRTRQAVGFVPFDAGLGHVNGPILTEGGPQGGESWSVPTDRRRLFL
jgi:hypothetical protein